MEEFVHWVVQGRGQGDDVVGRSYIFFKLNHFRNISMQQIFVKKRTAVTTDRVHNRAGKLKLGWIYQQLRLSFFHQKDC